jgi:hypothetical protein
LHTVIARLAAATTNTTTTTNTNSTTTTTTTATTVIAGRAERPRGTTISSGTISSEWRCGLSARGDDAGSISVSARRQRLKHG